MTNAACGSVSAGARADSLFQPLFMVDSGGGHGLGAQPRAIDEVEIGATSPIRPLSYPS